MTASAVGTPRLRLLVAAVGACLALGACSGEDGAVGAVGSGDVPSINVAGRVPSATTPAEPAAPPADEALVGLRPDPVPGLVRVDGGSGSLAARATAAYDAGSADDAVRVSQATSGEALGFARLCAGEVDLVDSSRPITATEWERCRDLGLDVVQLQVAADAVVVAIKAGTDVGGDCLDTDQLASILGAGSTTTSWSQVGSSFDEVPFRVAGPAVTTPALRQVASTVLGATEPDAGDLAAGYRAFADEAGTLAYVAGSPADRASTRYLPAVTARRDRVALALQQAWQALAAARDDVLAARGSGAADDVLREAYAARRVAAAEVERLQALKRPLEERYLRLRAAQARVAATTGTLGLFSQRFQRLHPDLLRPFEIEAVDGDDVPGCTYPDATGIADGSYPLSRPLLLTATTRALRRPEVADYLTSYLRNARDLATAAGMVALPGEVVAEQLGWIESGAYPVLTSVDGGPVVRADASPAQPDEPAAPVETPVR